MTLHERHVCRDCEAEIVMPYAKPRSQYPAGYTSGYAQRQRERLHAAIDECDQVGWDESRTTDLRPAAVHAAIDAALSQGTAHEERGLDQMRRLSEAATPGPWRSRTDGGRGFIAHPSSGLTMTPANAAFIVAAVNYVRGLLATPEAAPEEGTDAAYIRSKGRWPEAIDGPGSGSEYGRLLAARDRLIADGVDPVELEVPLPPAATPTPTTEDPHSIAATPEDNR